MKNKLSPFPHGAHIYLSEVGTALDLEERAAQKRLTRALEKLRRIFSRGGVTLTAMIIAGAVRRTRW